MNDAPWVVGVTGASGMRYAARLLSHLGENGIPTHVIVSEHATHVLRLEEEISFTYTQRSCSALLGREFPSLSFVSPKDIAASVASGSFRTRGMVIVPCSMSSLACIATGTGTNLIHRAADVCLKERRKLIIVPRESPLSEIHLQNLLTLARMRAVVLPACPGFYQKPATIEDLVDSVVMRILDHMEIPSTLSPRWIRSE